MEEALPDFQDSGSEQISVLSSSRIVTRNSGDQEQVSCYFDVPSSVGQSVNQSPARSWHVRRQKSSSPATAVAPSVRSMSSRVRQARRRRL